MIWKIILNAGTIIGFIRSFGAVAKDLVKDRRLPVCGESVLVLQNLKKLIDSGVIDIPGVDEKELSLAISNLEAELQCKP